MPVAENHYLYYASPRPEDLERLAIVSIGHFTAYADFVLQFRDGWPCEHLIYTLNGGALANIGGERIRVGAGELLLMPKDKPYYYWTDPRHARWEGRWVEYDGKWARELWTLMGLQGLSHVPDCLEASAAVEEIFALFEADPLNANHGAAGALWRVFAAAERSVLGARTRGSASEGAIDRARRFAAEHLADPLNLDDLAKAARLSPFHFARVFREKTGFTPAAYVRSLRMGRAQELLRRGDLSVKQVGLAVGFPVIQHFSGAFKKATGMTPREFARFHAGLGQREQTPDL
jgi:AraC-like DNA-binding protein